jgi:hypothetical protein
VAPTMKRAFKVVTEMLGRMGDCTKILVAVYLRFLFAFVVTN